MLTCKSVSYVARSLISCFFCASVPCISDTQHSLDMIVDMDVASVELFAILIGSQYHVLLSETWQSNFLR
jgi:hypothetical protein